MDAILALKELLIFGFEHDPFVNDFLVNKIIKNAPTLRLITDGINLFVVDPALQDLSATKRLKPDVEGTTEGGRCWAMYPLDEQKLEEDVRQIVNAAA